MHAQLLAQGAVPRFVGIKLGQVQSEGGNRIEAEVSMETMPSVLWDGMIVPSGSNATEALSESGHAMEFLKDQYRHCKTILLLGSAPDLLKKAAIPAEDNDPGLLRYNAAALDEAIKAFIAALSQHRHFARETDPPCV